MMKKEERLGFLVEIVGGIVVILLIALLVTYWQFFLALGIFIGVGYVLYKWGKAEEERQRKEALKRAKEAQYMARHLRDDVQRIAVGIRNPEWDSPQGDKILSAIFSASADNAILIGALMTENVTET